jgi:transcriptional regulator with XRE-family HTH domain
MQTRKSGCTCGGVGIWVSLALGGKAAGMEPDSTVGLRLRILRKERGLSQRDLAARAGLSANTISLIEREEISPSVATLQHLAGALGVRMSYFFESPAETDVIYAKANLRPRIISDGVTIEAIAARLSDQQLEPFYLTLAPHADAGARQVVHAGQEFVCCLRGHVAYEVAGIAYDLEPRDFLLFRAELPHYWHNPGEETAELLLVLLAAEPAGQLVRGHFPAHGSVEHLA